MSYYPIFIDLSKEKILIIGGGKVANRKASVLLEFGAEVHILSPYFDDSLYLLDAENKKINLINDRYDSSYLNNNYCLIIAATDDQELNSKICKDCNDNNLFVNNVSSLEDSNFIMASVLKKQDIVCGISCSGDSPILSQYIRDQLENLINDNIVEICCKLKDVREYVKQMDLTQNERTKILYTIQRKNGRI